MHGALDAECKHGYFVSCATVCLTTSSLELLSDLGYSTISIVTTTRASARRGLSSKYDLALCQGQV